MLHERATRLICCVVGFVLFPSSTIFAQTPEPDERHVYKTIGDVSLELHLFRPEASQADSPAPAIVFFFGGGWRRGSPDQFYPHCEYLAERGMVAMSADYRVESRHQTTPFECVEDGKSALRWIRSHAEELGIDPDRIAAGGGSAGGHVAAAVATVEGLNAEDEDTSISCVPNALVLFNPAYDNGPGGAGHDRMGERYLEISPLHNIREGCPPTIVFLGTEDDVLPVSTAEEFQSRMEAVGSRSELRLYEGQPHGFFNANRNNGVYYRETVAEMDAFLTSLGFLD